MRKLSYLPSATSTALAILLILAGINTLCGQTNDADVKSGVDNRIVAAMNAINKGGQANVLDLFSEAANERNRTIQELLKILKSPSSKRDAKLYAVYYLGAMHATEAIDSLASQITLETEGITGGSDYVVESDWSHISAADALAKIGVQSIPAMIRNLAESDNPKVKQLSLTVICFIDRDKDIDQLRLQKALKAETDPQKQARLQIALKALAGGPF